MPLNPSLELISAAHYHQEAGCHPVPIVIPANFLQIEIVTEGQGWVFFQDEWIEVNPGALLWLIPGDQTIGRSNFKNPYRCLSLFYRYDNIRDRAAPHYTQWLELDQLRTFTKDVVRLFVDESFDRNSLAEYAYSRSHFQANLNKYQNYDDSYPSGIRKALKHIDTHFNRPIKISDLAVITDWSMPHLSDMFKKHLDQSPHQILIKRRIRAAREKLSSSNDPIKSIAIDCGFATAAAFCHSFKVRTGETPAIYRKRSMRL